MGRRTVFTLIFIPIVLAAVVFTCTRFWNPFFIEYHLQTLAEKFPEAAISWEGLSGTRETPTIRLLKFNRDGQQWIFENVSWSVSPDHNLVSPRAARLTIKFSDHIEEFSQLQAQRVNFASQLELGDWQASWRPLVFGKQILTDVNLSGRWQGSSLSHRSDRDSFEIHGFDQHWKVTSAGAMARIEWIDFPVGEFLNATSPLVLHETKTEFVRRDDQLPIAFPEFAKVWREGTWTLGDRKLSPFADGFRSTDDGAFRIRITGEKNEIRAQSRRYDGAGTDTLLTRLLWNKDPNSLSLAQRAKLPTFRSAILTEGPTPLPPVTGDLGADFVLAAKGDSWWTDVLASARTGAPTEVLYFASVAKVATHRCVEARSWLADLIAHAAPTPVIGKSFALLAECENDVIKRRLLLESAMAYLPGDSRMRELAKITPPLARAPAAVPPKKSTFSTKKNPSSTQSKKSLAR